MTKPDLRPAAIVGNSLLLAPRQPLTARQRKLLTWAIWQLGRCNELHPCEIEVARFSRALKVNSGSVYTDIKLAAEDLRRSLVCPSGLLYDRHGALASDGAAVPWFSIVDTASPGVIRVEFSPSLARHLVSLRERFTQIRLRPYLRLSSTYSLAFFERAELHRWLSVKEWEATLPELRQWLGIAPGQYPSLSFLRRRVIDRAQTELAQHTDQNFTYRIRKDGRLTVFEFRVQQTASPTPVPAAKPMRDEELPDYIRLADADPVKLRGSVHLATRVWRVLKTSTPEVVAEFVRASGLAIPEVRTGAQAIECEEFTSWLKREVLAESYSWPSVHQPDDGMPKPYLNWLRTERRDALS